VGPLDPNYPGPGYYSSNDGMTHERAPEWKFSNNPDGGHSGPTMNSNNLGPGQYDFKPYLGEGPHYTLGQRRDGPSDPNYPAPGQYNQNDGLIHEKAP
jgi:Sperm-tail PG-rich repeat